MTLDFTTLAFLGSIGMPEMIVLGILGVLIFGKRLPEVGKSLGKGIVEFKKGLQGIDDDVDQSTQPPASRNLEQKPAPTQATTAEPADAVKVEPSSTPHSA